MYILVFPKTSVALGVPAVLLANIQPKFVRGSSWSLWPLGVSRGLPRLDTKSENSTFGLGSGQFLNLASYHSFIIYQS